jgi:serine/threonine protein kinase
MSSTPNEPSKSSESLDEIDLPPLPGPAWPVVPGYEILGELGSGSMGTVYRARQARLNRVVALKVFRAETVPPNRLSRFHEEARAVARLNHPSVVPIHEIGERQPLPGGPTIPFLVCDYIAGGSLAGHLHSGPIAWREAAGLVEALARAVHVCHERSIVHANLKPSNVLMGEGGLPRLADFALPRKREGWQRRILSGLVPGTLAYTAPEQAEGKKDIGPAVDIYALGAILYHMLSGRPPFTGKSPRETLTLIASASPPALHDLQVNVPGELEALMLRCLAKSPGDRPSSALGLADELRRILNASLPS